MEAKHSSFQHNIWFLAIGLAGLALIGWGAASQVAVARQPTAPLATIAITPDADSYVIVNDGSNYGSQPDLLVNYTLVGETYSRALIHFDMAGVTGQLPPGATVVTATLQLYLSTAITSSVTITASTGHVTDWTELGVIGSTSRRGAHPATPAA